MPARRAVYGAVLRGTFSALGSRNKGRKALAMRGAVSLQRPSLTHVPWTSRALVLVGAADQPVQIPHGQYCPGIIQMSIFLWCFVCSRAVLSSCSTRSALGTSFCPFGNCISSGPYPLSINRPFSACFVFLPTKSCICQLSPSID